MTNLTDTMLNPADSETRLNLQFNNRFVRELPADPDMENVRRQVLGACYSFVNPTQVRAPYLIAYSPEMATDIGLSADDCEDEWFTQVFAGNEQLAGMQPHAQCYGGHQFGNWAGQLGDGRAINLGEVPDQHGILQTLQLKGAGETPYSRSADGLAVLRSSVREFLCSEAMFHLGIPTTRALSLIGTGEQVMRDMFYDGRPKSEPGAVVCRVAPSFLRIGSYEIFSARQDVENLKKLVDFTICHHFPHLGEPNHETYLRWFREVCERSAKLVVDWMRVGFVHGVLNTDNTSILGLTIDYGPYGWIDDYDPDWTPNTTDADLKRYRFGHQAQIMQWNLLQLGNALYPLINESEPLRQILNDFVDDYTQKWQQMRADKLGLKQYHEASDKALNQRLQHILLLTETDMTLFYRQLAELPCESDTITDAELLSIIEVAWYAPKSVSQNDKTEIVAWLRQYQLRVREEGTSDAERKKAMNLINPKYVLRNYLAQQAIERAEKGDFSEIKTLLNVLRHPYDEQPAYQEYANKRPEWARHKPGCSMLSCSS
ncbi:protein adenylyltransferase SelO [Methylophaga frappieri]|nr:YdiU family protein [Methylophaga frappieri]